MIHSASPRQNFIEGLPVLYSRRSTRIHSYSFSMNQADV